MLSLHRYNKPKQKRTGLVPPIQNKKKQQRNDSLFFSFSLFEKPIQGVKDIAPHPFACPYDTEVLIFSSQEGVSVIPS